MADKGGLQLLPETRRKIDVQVPGQNRLIVIGVILLALLGAVYGGLAWYKTSLNNQIAAIDAQTVDLAKQRDEKAEKNLTTLSKQMAITGQIIQNHIFWSTTLSKVEAGLAGSVQFKSFSAQAIDSSLHIRSITDTYATIARQLAAFTGTDGIADVSLEGVNTLTSGKLDFNTKIIFDKSKFLTKPK